MTLTPTICQSLLSCLLLRIYKHIGTFPLPEAQLDRFFIKISLGYPGIREEISILDRHDGVASTLDELEAVVSAEDIIQMQDEVDRVVCSDAIKEYVALTLTDPFKQ